MIKLVFLPLLILLTVPSMKAQDTKPVLVIHGGAGTITRANMTPELEKAYQVKMEEALKAGFQILEEGGSGIDAIITTISIMENSPLFNAGKGAVLTNEGTAELDASIMDGKTLNAGAVAGVKTIKNPIEAAYQVMVNSPHVMLTGQGAEVFAKEQGLELVENSYFLTERRQMQYQQRKKAKKKMGTVGAVALDRNGNITAGTSTGGISNKKFGRVGDSPIIGAGTYAENGWCGISATGQGEYFIRNVVAYDINAKMKYLGISLQEAADQVIKEKLVNQGAAGGIIGIDKEGNYVFSFNTAGMYRGVINQEQGPQIFIYADDE